MELNYKEKFRDAVDVVIPGTKERRSRTEEEQQIMEWVKKTGRIPLQYQRERDGMHVEVSRIFDIRIKFALKQGRAVDEYGREYTFENPDNIFPMCGSYCVRAIADGDKSSDSYSLDYFV